MKGSWKTTAAGILSFIAVLAVNVSAFLDSNPETTPEWSAVGAAAVVAWGLFKARDNDVSSEQAGAK